MRLSQPPTVSMMDLIIASSIGDSNGVIGRLSNRPLLSFVSLLSQNQKHTVCTCRVPFPRARGNGVLATQPCCTIAAEARSRQTVSDKQFKGQTESSHGGSSGFQKEWW